MFTFYRNKKVLREYALHLSSKRDWVIARLADLGITSSMLSVDESELRYYLIDEFRRAGYKYTHLLTGLPFVLDPDFIKFVSFTVADSELSSNLNLVYDYLFLTETLENIYQFDPQVYTRRSPDKTVAYSAKTLKTYGADGKVLWSVHGVTSESVGSIPYPVSERVSLGSFYYKYYMRVCGSIIRDEWTFFEGLTREQELPFIRLVLEGYLEPTGEFAKSVWRSYFNHLRTNGVTVYRDLRDQISERWSIELSGLSSENYFVHHINEYEIAFCSTVDPKWEIYLPPVVVGGDVAFTTLEQGIGGDLTPHYKESNGVGYPVILKDGSKAVYYRKTSPRPLLDKVFNLSDVLGYLWAVGLNMDEKQPTPVAILNPSALQEGLAVLESRSKEWFT